MRKVRGEEVRPLSSGKGWGKGAEDRRPSNETRVRTQRLNPGSSVVTTRPPFLRHLAHPSAIWVLDPSPLSPSKERKNKERRKEKRKETKRRGGGGGTKKKETKRRTIKSQPPQGTVNEHTQQILVNSQGQRALPPLGNLKAEYSMPTTTPFQPLVFTPPPPLHSPFPSHPLFSRSHATVTHTRGFIGVLWFLSFHAILKIMIVHNWRRVRG